MTKTRLLQTVSAVVLIVSFFFASCGSPESQNNGLVIRDNLDRSVSIPSSVEKIVSLEPEITRIIVALGEGERLVGIDFFLKHQDHLFSSIFPQARELPVISNQGQDLNYEAALRLAPDVVFSSPSEYRMTESIEEKVSSPVLALASIGKFENLLREIEFLGQIFGKETRARTLTSYFRTKLDEIRRVCEAEDHQPRAYLSFWGSFLRTPVSYEPVDTAGGINLGAAVLPAYLGTAGATVQLEQILLWNPDIILIQGNYPPRDRKVTVEGILNDSRLHSIRAVRNRRVHYTFGFWYWWDPALVLLETAYLARLFHPDSFPGFDFEQEGNDIFKMFYGIEDAFSKLCETLKCHEWIIP